MVAPCDLWDLSSLKPGIEPSPSAMKVRSLNHWTAGEFPLIGFLTKFLPIYDFKVSQHCIHLFIYFWLHWVFVAVCGLSLVAVSGGHSLLQCAGFSLRWLLLLRSMGSRHMGFSSCGSQALEHRLSSCGARA